jgi:hypothetical protein
MKKFNPFGKVDMEIGSFIEKSRFNKEYGEYDYAQSFDINDISFDHVNREFENKFRKRYRNALDMISDDKEDLKSASGASTLGILEKMAQQIGYYDQASDFEESYEQIMKEYEPFMKT